ncbi:MAG: asparagine synthase-related protein [Thaumarchaeota archaeon]|nr:asparagine synthase-related protein [Nitrososphaerota archaeon]
MLSEQFEYSDLLPLADRESIEEIISGLRISSIGVINSLRGRNATLAYSGGIDSSIAGNLIANVVSGVSLLALGKEDSPDFRAVSESKIQYPKNAKIVIEKISKSDIETTANEISKIVNVSNLAHFEDCTAFWLIARRAKEIQGVDTLVSANGPDELFCGYDRFRRIADADGLDSAEKEIKVALKSASSLGREVKKVVSEFGLDFVEPFFQAPFVDFSLHIPINYKIILGNDLLRKRIWRYFGRTLQISEEIVTRPKKAMQYGMGLHRVILGMLKQGTLDPGV